jgi:hypothetical protein
MTHTLLDFRHTDDAYALGLQAYRENYATYRSVTKEGYILSYDDAVNFMANEQQKELLGVAVQLIRDINNKKYQVGQYSEDSHENQEIKQKILKLIADMKSESLGTKIDIAIFMTEFKPIFEEALSGLENYKPYIDFEERVSSLNNAFSKTEYAYYQYKEPSELDTLDVAETNWDSAKPKMLTWEKTFGGGGYDMASSLVQTTDGGYAILGETSSKGAGKDYVWFLKLDNKGNLLWDKIFGVGSAYDRTNSLIQTTDGGYAIVGEIYSKGAGGTDFWLLKLDKEGNLLWDRTYGGGGNDMAMSLIQTTDGGYAILGETSSKGAGGLDFWIIKLDKQGNLLWDKTFGGSDEETAKSLIQTTDGGYAVAGDTYSYGAGKYDTWVIKLDEKGNKIWGKIYGGHKSDWASSLIQTSEGEYVVAGYTGSFGAGKSDGWLIKLDNQGNLLWDRIYGRSDWDDSVTSLIQTSDGGYVEAGSTFSKGLTDADIWILKLDEQGNLGEISEEESISTGAINYSEELRVITSVISNFYEAINNQEWAQAKKYCLIDSEADLSVNEAKDTLERDFDSDTKINIEFIINYIDIDDISAKANCTQTLLMTCKGEIIQEGSNKGEILLENINNQWKIYEIKPQ